MSIPQLNVPPDALGGIVAIGNFDGVHRGHQAMLMCARRVAQKLSAPTVIVTFDPHPVKVLRPEVKLPVLTQIADRSRLLRQHGADAVIVLPVSRDLLSMGPEEFFDSVVVDQLQARGMVEGPDFRFGRDRAGDTAMLKTLCSSSGIELTVIAEITETSAMISSSRIRKQISSGDVSGAAQLLGRAPFVSGTVVRGDGRGRDLGYPTANLQIPDVLIPPDGVYAGRTFIDERVVPVAISVGANPTFDTQERRIECHLIDFDGDLYDQSLQVEWVDRIRGLSRFKSVQELKQAIARDVETCRRIVK